jgi:YggT family protein
MNVLIPLLELFNGLLEVYMWVIIIAALLTWVRPDPFNPIVQLLYRLTNPAYALVRRYIPTVFNGVDLAPLVIIISLKIVQILIAAAISTLRTL